MSRLLSNAYSPAERLALARWYFRIAGDYLLAANFTGKSRADQQKLRKLAANATLRSQQHAALLPGRAGQAIPFVLGAPSRIP